MLVYRRKPNEKSTAQVNTLTSESVTNKIEDFNNIVVMSGTAKRKTEKKENEPGIKFTSKNNFKENFSKLRAPFYKPHQKQIQAEEKIMTKSCETLLECIKPYIRTRKTATVTESVQTFGSVLKTTDFIYETKATRKVQFLTLSEENPEFLWHKEKLWLKSNLDKERMELDSEVMDEANTNVSLSDKTVSSEDFITDVFSVPKPAF